MKTDWRLYPQEKPEKESKQIKYLVCDAQYRATVRAAAYFDGEFQKYWGGWHKCKAHYWMPYPDKPPFMCNAEIPLIDYGLYSITPKLVEKLKEINIFTMGNLLEADKETLMSINGFGKKRMENLLGDLEYEEIPIPKSWQE